MGTNVSIHGAVKISAYAGGTSGAPLTITVGREGLDDMVTLFTENFDLSRNLAAALNATVDGGMSHEKLIDAIKGLIGLCQLVRNRGDLPAEARLALTHNHRIIAAYEALSAAGVEGFQPSDFDAHKIADAA